MSAVASNSTENLEAQYQRLQQEMSATFQRLTEIDGERTEHQLVLDTLRGLDDGKRRCMRLVGGVLCETTVDKVQPVLIDNLTRITMVLDQLSKTLEEQERALNQFKQANNIDGGTGRVIGKAGEQ